MKAFPSERIGSLLQRAKKESKFYRRRLQGLASRIKSPASLSYEDFRQIPYTTRLEVKDNREDLLSVPMDEIVRLYLSSGTKGAQKQSFLTRNDLEVLVEDLKHFFSLAGLTKGSYFMPILGYGHSGATEAVSAADSLGAISVPVSIYDPGSALGILPHIGSTTVLCFPTIFLSLGHAYIESGLTNVTTLLSGAELMTQSTRTRLEHLWKTKRIFELYGSVETGALGFGYPECNGVHMIGESSFVELINPATQRPAGNYELGEVVVTTFREGSPLIRYLVGDIGVRLPSVCECGLETSLKVKILGRSDDLFIIGTALVFPIELQAICDSYYDLSGHRVSKLFLDISRSQEDERETLGVGVATQDAMFDMRGFVQHFVAQLQVLNRDFRNGIEHGAVKVEAGRVHLVEKPQRKVSIEIRDLRSEGYLEKIRAEKLVEKQVHREWRVA